MFAMLARVVVVQLCCLADAKGNSRFWENAKQQVQKVQQLQKKVREVLVDDDSAACTPHQLMAPEAFSVDSTCSGPDDALRVEEIHYDPVARALIVQGVLSKKVSGGEVVARVHLRRSSAGSGVGSVLKRQIAWLASGAHRSSRPLCDHVARTFNRSNISASCPFQPGPQEFRLAFEQLPKLVAAGEYGIEIRAADDESQPIFCVSGSIDIPRGPGGELFRRLERDAPGRKLVACCSGGEDACNDCRNPWNDGVSDRCSDGRTMRDNGNCDSAIQWHYEDDHDASSAPAQTWSAIAAILSVTSLLLA